MNADRSCVSVVNGYHWLACRDDTTSPVTSLLTFRQTRPGRTNIYRHIAQGVRWAQNVSLQSSLRTDLSKVITRHNHTHIQTRSTAVNLNALRVTLTAISYADMVVTSKQNRTHTDNRIFTDRSAGKQRHIHIYGSNSNKSSSFLGFSHAATMLTCVQPHHTNP